MDKRKDNKGRNLKQGEIQKKDGRYEYRYTDWFGTRHSVYSWRLTDTDPTPAGRRVDESLRAKEKKIAIASEKGLLIPVANSLTVNDLLEMEKNEWSGLAENTVRYRVSMLENIIKPSIGKLKVASLDYHILYDFFSNTASEHGYFTATVCRLILKNIVAKAIKLHAMDRNIVSEVFEDSTKKYKNVRLIEHNDIEDDRLTEQQRNAFIEYMNDPDEKIDYYTRLVVTFLLGTGCRVSEALGMSWNNICFDQKIVKVRWQAVSNRAEIKETKTKSGVRSIYLMDDLAHMLQKEKLRQTEANIHISMKGMADGDSLVFVFKDRKKWENSTLQARLLKIDKRYAMWAERHNKPDIPHLHPHLFRHTYCYTLSEAGVDIKVLQQQAGHARVSMTLDRYVKKISDDRIIRESSKTVEGNVRLL